MPAAGPTGSPRWVSGRGSSQGASPRGCLSHSAPRVWEALPPRAKATTLDLWRRGHVCQKRSASAGCRPSLAPQSLLHRCGAVSHLEGQLGLGPGTGGSRRLCSLFSCRSWKSGQWLSRAPGRVGQGRRGCDREATAEGGGVWGWPERSVTGQSCESPRVWGWIPVKGAARGSSCGLRGRLSGGRRACGSGLAPGGVAGVGGRAVVARGAELRVHGLTSKIHT